MPPKPPTRKYPSGSEKRKKKQRLDNVAQSQSRDILNFFGTKGQVESSSETVVVDVEQRNDDDNGEHELNEDVEALVNEDVEPLSIILSRYNSSSLSSSSSLRNSCSSSSDEIVGNASSRAPKPSLLLDKFTGESEMGDRKNLKIHYAGSFSKRRNGEELSHLDYRSKYPVKEMLDVDSDELNMIDFAADVSLPSHMSKLDYINIKLFYLVSGKQVYVNSDSGLLGMFDLLVVDDEGYCHVFVENDMDESVVPPSQEYDETMCTLMDLKKLIKKRALNANDKGNSMQKKKKSFNDKGFGSKQNKKSDKDKGEAKGKKKSTTHMKGKGVLVDGEDSFWVELREIVMPTCSDEWKVGMEWPDIETLRHEISDYCIKNRFEVDMRTVNERYRIRAKLLYPRRVYWKEYCSSYYWVSTYKLAYMGHIMPMPDMSEWPMNCDTMPRLACKGLLAAKKDKHGKKSQEETQASAPVPDEALESTEASQASSPTQASSSKAAKRASSETPQSTAQPATLTFGPPRVRRSKTAQAQVFKAPEQRHTFGDFLSKQPGKSSTSVLEAPELTFTAGGTVRAPIVTKRPKPHGPGSTPFMPARDPKISALGATKTSGGCTIQSN
ncbi:hypothetical protein IFM89_015819 [Coptis chinensis]|uniref:Uncharacterized protein n=1 Tax=Coptis chinensis TaxID=261450 RepID=A0A835IQT6_9MAGN|nr:hypothetical protein IFM89_015819 [Coptis chinensis]